LTDEPEVVEGVKTHPCAVPAFEKSPAAIPETVSLNDTPKVRDIADAGEEGVLDTEAVGGSTSMSIVVELTAGGPVNSEVLPVTDPWATETPTDPVVAFVDARTSEYVSPEPVSEEILHVALVPEIVISDVENPVTGSEN
jgi:hypothetical protein